MSERKLEQLLRRLLCVASLLYFANLGNTQTAVWQNESLSDTLRLKTLDSLAYKVHWTEQPDSAFFYLDQMIILARAVDYGSYFRRGLRRRAQLYFQLSNFEAAIPANEERIRAYEAATYDSLKRFRYLSISHFELAYCLRKLGRTAESLKQYEKSLQYAEAIGEDGLKHKANALNSLGNLYFNIRDYPLAKEKYQQGLAIYRSTDNTMGVYNTLNNLGLVASKTGKYEEALELFSTSLEMKKEAGDKKRMANTYGSIGDIYLIQGREEEAKDYFLQAKALQEELGLRDELTRSLTQLGDLARVQGNPALAVKYCSQSCVIATEDGLWQASLACNKCLYEAHKALGNSRIALQSYEAYVAVKDSMFSMENSREIAELEARLTYEKQLVEAETEQLQLESKAEREQLLRWIFLGSTLGLALLSWFALRLGRLRRRQNQALLEKNGQIASDREVIRQQALELQQTAELKNRFFGNVSHELRTPLTLVISPLEQLINQSNSLSDQDLKALTTVQNNAGKLLHLVEELLELSQLEAGTATAEQNTIEVPAFLQQVFENYQLLAQEKGIDYQFSFNGTSDFTLLSDERRLEKILDNLLGNALKFTPTGGQVALEVSAEDAELPQLQIQVRDNGPGIAEEDITHIFDRYYQAREQNGSMSGGTGIGLALAQESAQLLGGQLSVESTLGEGSIFTLILPLSGVGGVGAQLTTAPVGVLDKNSTDSASVVLANPSRILIVEDSLELQQFLAEILKGHECSLASNGREALHLLREAQTDARPFDLVVTDLMMPEMSGSELIQQVKEDATLSSTRLVVLTAKRNRTEKLALLRIGVDDYMTKPFSPEELLVRVNNLLKYSLGQVEDQEEADSNQSPTWLQEVEQYVLEKLEQRQDLSAGDLAIAFNLSNRQLLRRIRAATGLSTQLYLQECKLQLARQYLEQRRFPSLTEVSQACGFKTPGYFSSVFEERFGIAASEYLKK